MLKKAKHFLLLIMSTHRKQYETRNKSTKCKFITPETPNSKFKRNVNTNLTKAYSDGFNTVSSTFLDLPSTLTGIENMLNNNNLSYNAAQVSGKTAQDYRNGAETAYYSAQAAYEKNKTISVYLTTILKKVTSML